VLHSWEILAQILQNDEAKDIICDIGMCVLSELLIALTAGRSSTRGARTIAA